MALSNIRIGLAWLLASAIAASGSSAAAEDGKSASLGAWSPRAQLAWWKAHPDPASWLSAKEAVHRQLIAIQDRVGLSTALGNPHFLGWVEHLQWLQLFPDDWEKREWFQNPENRNAYRRLALESKLAPLLVRSLSHHDDGYRALENLCRIYHAHPKDALEFPDLAVALAVVFDQEFPGGWPHPFVVRAGLPIGDPEPENRFAFYVESARNDRLLLDVSRLSVSELKFLVDSPLELRELAYAQQIRLRNAGHLKAIYPQLKYDQPRLARKSYVWPHGAYRLIDIGKKGGICADQAYFVSQTGKAKGIPAILFLGQGRSGEHAWVGYLGDGGRWELDLAKIRSEDYPVGQAFDPQTWRRITEAEIEFLNKGLGRSLRYAKARQVLLWARMNSDAPFTRGVLQAARKFMPQNLETWELEAGWLDRHKAPAAERVKFWRSWVRNFHGQTDVEFRGQLRLLAVLREAGDDSAAQRLTDSIVSRHDTKRFDLGIRLAAEEVFSLLDRKDWAGALKTYRSVLTRFQRKAGGHLFYNLVQPYVTTCLEEGRSGEAREALELAAKTFDPKPGSILAREMRELREMAGK